MHDVICVDEGCRSDLRFWSYLCDNWNGVSFFYDDRFATSVSMHLFTDAAPSLGFGGVFGGEWFADKWPVELRDLPSDVQSIALMELYPIVMACLIWGRNWTGRKIMFCCDNEATVAIINKGRSSIPFINRLVRRITWTSIQCSFIFSAAHIPGLDNRLADHLSRFNFHAFQELCPGACPRPRTCLPFSKAVLD